MLWPVAFRPHSAKSRVGTRILGEENTNIQRNRQALRGSSRWCWRSAGKGRIGSRAAGRRRGRQRAAAQSGSAVSSPAVISRLGLRRDLDDYRIFEAWEQVVGAQIARNAQPTRLDTKRLVVTVKSAVWMQELSLLREDIRPQAQQMDGARDRERAVPRARPTTRTRPAAGGSVKRSRPRDRARWPPKRARMSSCSRARDGGVDETRDVVARLGRLRPRRSTPRSRDAWARRACSSPRRERSRSRTSLRVARSP